MYEIKGIKNSFVRILFCFIVSQSSMCAGIKPECVSEECWSSYTKTWVNSRNEISGTDDIHEQMAYRVMLAVKKDIPDLGFSNVASFALSIKYESGDSINLLLPFVIASCEVKVTEDSFAYYWQYNKRYMPLISVNSFFQSIPTHGFSTALATKSFVERLRQRHVDAYEGENWQLEKALSLLDSRIESESYLAHIIKPAGAESGESNDILRSILHCEQVVIDRLIVDDTFLDLFLGQLGQKKGEIVGIDFCIDTYNDMCPKCFSTCKHMKRCLLTRITDRLKYLGHNVSAEPVFRFLISSHRAYKIPESGYVTRSVWDSSCCESELIFQFPNNGESSAVGRINLIDQARGQICEEIDKLFWQIKTMGISIPNGKSPIAEKKYSEQMASTRKALAGKKDRAFPPDCSAGPVYEEIQAENRYLATLRSCVEEVLISIEQKITELTALHYFLTTDELRATTDE